MALARNINKDIEEVVNKWDHRKERKVIFLDWEIRPLLGQIEWELGPKNLVKDLDFQVSKAPTASTTTSNKSAI